MNNAIFSISRIVFPCGNGGGESVHRCSFWGQLSVCHPYTGRSTFFRRAWRTCKHGQRHVYSAMQNHSFNQLYHVTIYFWRSAFYRTPVENSPALNCAAASRWLPRRIRCIIVNTAATLQCQVCSIPVCISGDSFNFSL